MFELTYRLSNAPSAFVDDSGAIVFEGSCLTDPGEIFRTISDKAGHVEKIVHASSPFPIWLTRELSKHGAPVVCIDTRAAHKVLQARMNKPDRPAAVTLAQLARKGWCQDVGVKSGMSDRLRLMLSARERLIRICIDVEGQVRGY
jgi:transposase